LPALVAENGWVSLTDIFDASCTSRTTLAMCSLSARR